MTAEVEAFELVAKGRALLAQRGRSLVLARDCFDRAIALNPTNADAHAGLGDTLLNFVRYGILPVAEGRPFANAALARALELDADHAPAAATMGMLSMQLEHDPDAAIRWWERALALQPRMAEVRASYAVHALMFSCRDDVRGLAELARAVSDDPRSAFCALHNSIGLVTAGRHEESAAEAERACVLDPQAFLPLYSRVAALSRMGAADRALSAGRTAMDIIGRHPLVIGFLPRCYMLRGDIAGAEAMYAEMQARLRNDDVSRMTLAIAADDIGRVDDAIGYAFESVQRCDFTIPFWSRRSWTSDAFRAHPRYPELLRAMGL